MNLLTHRLYTSPEGTSCYGVVPCVSPGLESLHARHPRPPFSLRPERLSSAADDLMVWVTEARGRRNTRVYRDSERSSAGEGLSLIRDGQVDPEPRVQELNDFIYGWARSRRLMRMSARSTPVASWRLARDARCGQSGAILGATRGRFQPVSVQCCPFTRSDSECRSLREVMETLAGCAQK